MGDVLNVSGCGIAKFLAAPHSLTALPVFSKVRIARYMGFGAASSFGKLARVFVVFLVTRFKLSIAFVVEMTLRTAGGNAKNAMTSSHARRQLGAIEGHFWPHSASLPSVA